MNILRRLGVSTFLLCSTVSAIEWESQQAFVSVGGGYAAINSENYESAPLITLSGGLTVPLLVEQHLRGTVGAQLNYLPVIPEAQLDVFGGAVTSLSLSALVEHDLLIGANKIWVGLGPSVSSRYVFNQYQYQTVSGYSVPVAQEVDSSLAFSAELVGRIDIPLNEFFSIGLNGQYTPLSNSFSGFYTQINYRF